MNNLPIAPLPGFHLLNRRSVLRSSMLPGENQNVTEGNRKPLWDDRYRPNIFHATSRKNEVSGRNLGLLEYPERVGRGEV